jgi:photosynthesis system II assembly factor YCF48-like protein/putative zinc finger protein
MEQLPKIVRHRMRAASASTPHPDPDLLTAFAEQSLTEREKSQVLDHLAQCAECREVMKVASTPAAEPVAVGFAPQAVFSDAARSLPMPHASMRLEDLGDVSLNMPRSRRWLNWHTLRWGALAACVVAMAGVLMLPTAKHTVPAASSSGQKPEVTASLVNRPAAREQADEAQLLADNKAVGEAIRRAPKLQYKSGGNEEVISKNLEGDEFRQTLSKGTRGGGKTSPDFALRADRSNGVVVLPPYEKIGAASAPPAAPPAPVLDKLEAAQASRAKTPAAAGAVGGTSEIAAGKPQRAEAPVAQTEKTPASTADLKSSEAKKDGQTAELADARVFKQSGVASAESVSTVAGNLHMVQKKQWPRCTVGADGTLQSSYDAGKTWKRVSVGEEGIIFRAVSTYGPDVWAGGAKGALFHSADAGQRWTRVKPMADGTLLTDDIVLVEFADMQRGKLITAGHATWVTADGGRTWTRQ